MSLKSWTKMTLLWTALLALALPAAAEGLTSGQAGFEQSGDHEGEAVRKRRKRKGSKKKKEESDEKKVEADEADEDDKSTKKTRRGRDKGDEDEGEKADDADKKGRGKRDRGADDEGDTADNKRDTDRRGGRKTKERIPPSKTNSEIGFAVRELTEGEIKELGRKYGLMVTMIEAGSPADDAGLREGDIITATGGVSAKLRRNAFEPIIEATKGDEIKISIVRNGKDKLLELEAPEDEAEREEREKREREQESEEERKKREEEEEAQREKEEEEREAREEEEERRRQQEIEDDEAEHEQDLEKIETIAEAEDNFTLLNCVVCSICVWPLTPVWVALWLLVDAEPAPPQTIDPNIPRERRKKGDERDVTIVSY